MGVDAFIIRHRSSGVPKALTQWTTASIINAGDGWHQHPTQGLLDAYTMCRELGRGNDLTDVRVAIVGDVLHSRVARSTSQVLAALGAKITFVAPSTLIPLFIDGWNVDTATNIDEVIESCDVLYMLRMQKERMSTAVLPDINEYCDRFALTSTRAKRLKGSALLLHPGPMNRGVEMQVDPSQLTQSRITQQVTNGIAVRMAVLFSLLGTGVDAALSQGSES
jgi:aspartate carbamoyltransferase catalytic subunit